MKISREQLKQMIREEFGKMRDTAKVAKETPETEADEIGDTLEKPEDFVKLLKLKEARLQHALKRLLERKQQYVASQKK
jgi:hypothetical protein